MVCRVFSRFIKMASQRSLFWYSFFLNYSRLGKCNQRLPLFFVLYLPTSKCLMYLNFFVCFGFPACKPGLRFVDHYKIMMVRASYNFYLSCSLVFFTNPHQPHLLSKLDSVPMNTFIFHYII